MTPATCGRAPGSSIRPACCAAPASASASSRHSVPSASTGRTGSTAPTSSASRPPAGSCISSSATSSKRGAARRAGSPLPQLLFGRCVMTRAVMLWAWVGLLAGVAAPAGAQVRPSQPSLKIGFISSRQILQQTPGYAAAEPTFNKEVQGFRDEVQKLQQQLDSARSEEHTSELQSQSNLVCRLLLEKKTKKTQIRSATNSLNLCRRRTRPS